MNVERNQSTSNIKMKPSVQDTAADPFGMDQKIKNLQDMALSISRQGRQQAKRDDTITKERNSSM